LILANWCKLECFGYGKIQVSARPLLCQGSRGCLHPMPRCSPHHSGDSTTCVESLTTGFAVYCSYKTLEILNVRTKIHEQHQEMDNKQQRWSLLHLFQEFSGSHKVSTKHQCSSSILSLQRWFAGSWRIWGHLLVAHTATYWWLGFLEADEAVEVMNRSGDYWGCIYFYSQQWRRL
jgi:hypothetical protein